jgi:hypothetical protein
VHQSSGILASPKRYFVGTGAVTSVSYNTSTSQYMVASADGHMSYIAASNVGADTDGNL